MKPARLWAPGGLGTARFPIEKHHKALYLFRLFLFPQAPSPFYFPPIPLLHGHHPKRITTFYLTMTIVATIILLFYYSSLLFYSSRFFSFPPAFPRIPFPYFISLSSILSPAKPATAALRSPSHFSHRR